MARYFLFLALAVALVAFQKKPVLVRFSLPAVSSLYPDSFAIHWTYGGTPPAEKLPIRVHIMNLYGDEVFISREIKDSIADFRFENFNERKLIISSSLPQHHRGSHDTYGLRIMAKRPAIEEMKVVLAFDPTLEHYLSLAEAYEKEECYVNAIFVYHQMMKLDSIRGSQYWQTFQARNRQKFYNNVQR